MSANSLRPILLQVLVLLASAAQADDWVTSVDTGCQIAAPGSTADTVFRWQGECVAGKAQGNGILTSSRGGLLQGEFKAGVPFNTHGFWPLKFNSGGTVMAQHQVTDGGAPFWDTLELPDAQGKSSPTTTAALAGEWEFTSGDGKCRERHSYRVDGSYVAKSGEEVMAGAFAVMDVANANQVLGFVRSAIAANGKKDCSGNRAPLKPDRTNFFYLVRESPDSFAICGVSPSPLRCFGNFKRVAE